MAKSRASTAKNKRPLGSIRLPKPVKIQVYTNAKGITTSIELQPNEAPFEIKELTSAHTLIVLSDLFQDVLNDFDNHSETTGDLKKAFEKVASFTHSMLEDSFTVEKIRTTDYIQRLAKEVRKVVLDNLELM